MESQPDIRLTVVGDGRKMAEVVVVVVVVREAATAVAEREEKFAVTRKRSLRPAAEDRDRRIAVILLLRPTPPQREIERSPRRVTSSSGVSTENTKNKRDHLGFE